MESTRIGRYEIREELGRGGMATVYRAFDPLFSRDVAVKVLPRELLHDPEFRVRFEREARLIAALEHPAIVPVYDFGHEHDQPYLVMRIMSGGSLADRLKTGPLPLDQTGEIVTRLARALDRAHKRGIIHRDLKPSNFLLDEEGDPYIADFGIAKMTAESSTYSRTAIIGTPAYMSPEQWHGDDPDARCDVYSLGVIVFELLTGRVPYEGKSPPVIMKKHLTEPVPRIHQANPQLPVGMGVQAVIERALAKEKDERFATAGDLAKALAATVRKEIVSPPSVIITPPVIAKPIDLGFELSGHQNQLVGWYNGFRFVPGASKAYQYHLRPRSEGGSRTCLAMQHPTATDEDFGVLMQRCPAIHLRGREICFEGEIATQDVDQWAGIWLRVDGTRGMLFFDNMEDRPIRGTTRWTKYQITTHLSEEAKWLNYGIVLVGRGILWADNFQLRAREANSDWVDLDKYQE